MTESDLPTGGSAAPALAALTELTFQSLVQAGNLFGESYDGVTSHLPGLLKQYGLQNIQTRAYRPEYRFGTLQWQLFFEDVKLFYQTAIPFLRRWTRVPDNYEELYQQMLTEMQQPDFVVIWPVLTAWGTNAARRGLGRD